MKEIKSYKLGGGVFLIRDGKVLLGYQKRSYENPCWGTPGGKVNDKNCTVAEAMEKEVLEETGIQVNSLKPLTWFEDVIDDTDLISFQFYTIDFEGEVKVMEPEKCERWEWFSLNKLPENLTESIRRLVEEGLLPKLEKV